MKTHIKVLITVIVILLVTRGT
uniref:Uncharacterized protein n=1 Tax=Lepeophtheirus salmonis TaxID=72036 RepID=A0A0K2UTH2_LEPSM